MVWSLLLKGVADRRGRMAASRLAVTDYLTTKEVAGVLMKAYIIP